MTGRLLLMDGWERVRMQIGWAAVETVWSLTVSDG